MIRQLEEREKRALRRALGVKKPFDGSIVQGPEAPIKKVRDDYYAPWKDGYVPARPKGRRGAYLSPAKRAIVDGKAAARVAFLRSLGARV